MAGIGALMILAAAAGAVCYLFYERVIEILRDEIKGLRAANTRVTLDNGHLLDKLAAARDDHAMLAQMAIPPESERGGQFERGWDRWDQCANSIERAIRDGTVWAPAENQ